MGAFFKIIVVSFNAGENLIKTIKHMMKKMNAVLVILLELLNQSQFQVAKDGLLNLS